MKELKHEHEIRVRYKETDKMGVVYSGNYFTYFEVGRTEQLRSLGYTYRDMEEKGFMLPVVETYCRHRKPALYDDLVIIETVSTLRRSFIRFDYTIRNKGEDTVLSEGYTVHVFTNNEQKVISPPNYIKELYK